VWEPTNLVENQILHNLWLVFYTNVWKEVKISSSELVRGLVHFFHNVPFYFSFVSQYFTNVGTGTKFYSLLQ
jgi:hypothetical protein